MFAASKILMRNKISSGIPVVGSINVSFGTISQTTSTDISSLGLQEDDYVLLFVAAGTVDVTTDYSLTTAGFSSLKTKTSTSTAPVLTSSCKLYGKHMTATPDGTIVLDKGSMVSADAAGAKLFAFRGVSLGNPLDVAITSTTGLSSWRANPPSIAPSTSGAYVVAFGCGAADTTGAYTSSLSGFLATQHTDNTDCTVGGGYTTWTGGTVDPAGFGSSVGDSAGAWCAVTIALRPTY